MHIILVQFFKHRFKSELFELEKSKQSVITKQSVMHSQGTEHL